MATHQPFRNTLMITGIIAALSVGLVIYAYWGTSSFLMNAQRTKGEIIGFEKQRKVFRPIIEFRTIQGDTVQFTALMGDTDTLQVKTGSKVKILYHPSNPSEDVVLDDFWQIWFPLMMILLFGLVPFLFVLMLKMILVPPTKTS